MATTLDPGAIPSDVDRVAFLWDSGEGTPIRALSGALSIELPEELGPTRAFLVLGWRSTDALGEVDGASIRRARDADPTLPRPSWIAEGHEGSEALEAAAFTVEVTAPWVTPCPAVSEPRARVSCTDGFCAPEIAQVGCAMTIDASSCANLGTASLRLSPLESTGGTRSLTDCHVAAAGQLGFASLACQVPMRDEACTIELLRGPHSGGVGVETLELVDVPPYAVSHEGKGVFSGVGVTSEGLLVLGPGEGLVAPACQAGLPYVMKLLDSAGNTLEVNRMPPCPSRLVAAPGGSVAYFLFGAERSGVAKVDARGRILTTATVAESRMRGLRGSKLQVVGRGEELLVIFETDRAGDPGGLLAALDANDLSVLRSRVLPFGTTGFAVGVDEILLFDDNADEAHVVSPSTFLDLGGFSLMKALSRTLITEGFFHEVSGRYLLEGRGEYHPMIIASSTGRVVHTHPYTVDFEGEAISSWPGDPSLVLLGVDDRGDDEAYLALFDPVAEVFLPEVTALGARGIVSYSAVDVARRSVWLAQPESGRIYRAFAK
ncbi:MAG: hypothetical protein HYV07_19860 [Deltaproteobacteria bacterium]|nr:hypothetical protein [Deltaproteobacteria bacterium]